MSARACYVDMPFTHVLFRYVWPFWLFKDATRGDRYARAAAYRHNRDMRIHLPGYLLRWVLVSPFLHQWHHAKDAAAIGKNVGVVFAWNDRLFGTAYDPEHWPVEFGLSVPAPERVGQSYVRHLLYPLQYAAARLQARRDPKPALV